MVLWFQKCRLFKENGLSKDGGILLFRLEERHSHTPLSPGEEDGREKDNNVKSKRKNIWKQISSFIYYGGFRKFVCECVRVRVCVSVWLI